MNDAVVSIIVALITGLSVAIPTIIATITSNKAHDLVVDEKMKTMSDQVTGIGIKIDKYSDDLGSLRERLGIVEQSAKSAHHRLDGMQTQLNVKDNRKDR